MDAVTVGKTIARLRKQHGLTQSALAKRLNVSDKTVSKWESGLGYPEIIQFPTMAALFGVTVDFLMTGHRKGIAVAGNILTDIVKQINIYPAPGMLANIESLQQAVGGCVPNTAMDLVRIDRTLPVSAIGRVGNDEYGRFVLGQMSRLGVNCDGVTISDDLPTSFSDVMSLPTGERTFFHTRGANAEFSPSDVSIESLTCAMLHIGYILLLNCFDAPDEEYGTVMARFLHDVEAQGIRTSIDVVSDAKGDYRQKVLPALRQCSYVIINELEGGLLSGIEPRGVDGQLLPENIRRSMIWMAEQGVKEKVIIHSREASFCLDVPTGAFTQEASLAIPPEAIRGNVGAGDAFCAGCLYSIYHHYDDMRMLSFASAAAACSLFAENATDGIRPRIEIEKLNEKFGRLPLPARA